MKKITLALFGVVGFFGSVLAQPVLNLAAPQPTNSSTQLRLPNGLPEHKSLRGVMLIRPAELTQLTTNAITSASFVLLDGTDPVACVGNFSLWLQGTQNTTNSKIALGFSGALAGMTQVAGATPNNFNVTTAVGTQYQNIGGFASFPYVQGDGLYVAWAWEETTPATNSNTYAATWLANNAGTGNGLCGTSNASVALGAPNTLTVTDFRPVIVFSGSNTATNEASVEFLYTPGKVEKASGSAVNIQAIVKNGSNGTLSNIPVGLVVSGANNAVPAPQIIPSLAGGASTVMVFNYTPTNLGNDIITFSVANTGDQAPANNSMTATQSITCKEMAIHPSLTAGSYTSQGYGAGSSTSGLIYSFRYQPGVNCSATGVRLVVPGFSNAANLGKTIFAILQDNTGAIVAQGPNVTITSAMLDNFSTLTFTTPVPLTSGQDYNFGVGMPANAYFPIGVTAFNGPVITGYFSSPITGGSFNALTVGHLSLEGVLSFTNLEITASPNKTVVCKSSPQQLTLTATGADTYSWSSNVPNTGGAGTVVFTPTAPANVSVAQVTVAGNYTTGAGSGCKSNVVTMQFSLTACTGIAENTGAALASVYPNPAIAGKTMISGLEGANTITVFNSIGQVVINKTTESQTESIDLSAFPSGTYLVKITDATNSSKVVKLIN